MNFSITNAQAENYSTKNGGGAEQNKPTNPLNLPSSSNCENKSHSPPLM